MTVVKRIILISKKDGMSAEEFRHHYETSHAPIMTGHPAFRLVRSYKRNFIDHAATYPATAQVDYDVMTEMTWENEQNYKEYIKAMYAPDIMKLINEDEEKFQKPGSIRMLTVREETSR